MLSKLNSYLKVLDYNAVEECWKQGKGDLLVSRYYPKFPNLKSARANKAVYRVNKAVYRVNKMRL